MNIDVHAHYLPPARIDLRREVSSGGLAANERDDMSDLARRVPDMAERAINVQLLFLAQVSEDYLVRPFSDGVHHTCLVMERIENHL